MPLRERFTVTAAVVEATEGTNPGLATANAVRAWGASFAPGRDWNKFEHVDGSLSPFGGVPGAGRIETAFKTYLIGRNAADGDAVNSLAEHDPLFRMCGWTPTYNAESAPAANDGSVVFRRGTSTGNGTSATLGGYEDGRLFTVVGCRGNWQMALARGKPIEVSWSAKGRYAAPTTATVLASTDMDTANPPAWLTTNLATLTPSGGGAYNPQILELTFDRANEVQEWGNANEANGVGGFEIIGGETKGTMKVIAPLETAHGFFANRDASTTYALSVQVGTTVQLRLVIAAPVLQIMNIGPSVTDGLRTYDIDFVCRRSAVGGNDELTLTFT